MSIYNRNMMIKYVKNNVLCSKTFEKHKTCNSQTIKTATLHYKNIMWLDKCIFAKDFSTDR